MLLHAQRDPIAAKQRSTQQAKLATRRLRSQLLHKRQSGQSMGNSLMLAKASLSLIRGGEDVSLGWDSSSRTASLLCFDEMQVRVPAILPLRDCTICSFLGL